MAMNHHHTPKTTMERARIIFHLTMGPTSLKFITFKPKLQETQHRCIYKTPLEGALFEHSLNTTLFQIRILPSIGRFAFKSAFKKVTLNEKGSHLNSTAFEFYNLFQLELKSYFI